MTRRTALGLAMATALPRAVGSQAPPATAEPISGTWAHAGNAARTGVFSGKGPDLDRNITERWRIDGSQAGKLIFAYGVCDGIVYYVPVPDGISDEIRPLIAVDAQSGTELWRREPPASEPSIAFSGKSAIADGLLVIPSYTGVFSGLDAKTGELRWTFDMNVHGVSAQANPAIVDGVLYVSDNASVNAVTLGDTPEWLWKAPLADGEATVLSGTVSVDGEYVVVSSMRAVEDAGQGGRTTEIHVLNVADGTEAYRYQFGAGGESNLFALQEGALFSRTDKGYLDRSHLFSMTIDGNERWSFRTGSAASAYPAVRGELVFVAAGDGISAIDAATGEEVWSSPLSAAINSGIVLHDDVIYVGTDHTNQALHALSAADGTLLESIPLPLGWGEVIGITDGLLIAESGTDLVAFGNQT